MVGYVSGSFYYYEPNRIAPVLFAVAFALSGAYHFYQTARCGLWKTTGLMSWAALLLSVGLILRETGSFYYKHMDILISGTVMIMSAPLVYALVNCMILSKLFQYMPYFSPVHPGRVWTTFVLTDGICEILIVSGVQRMGNRRLPFNERSNGATLIKVALSLQAILFVMFIGLGGIFHWRAQRAGTLSKKLRTVMLVMYVSCTIITARCLYRIIEFFQGFFGEVYTHEVYFYIFEVSIMFVNTVLLNGLHPGKYLPRSNNLFLSRDGVTELRGPGWRDDRKPFVAIVDPFDLWSLLKGQGKKIQFWEMEPTELKALVEQEDRKKEEEERLPKPAWKKILDPLHIFGSKGKLVQTLKGLEKPNNDVDMTQGNLETSLAISGSASQAESTISQRSFKADDPKTSNLSIA